MADISILSRLVQGYQRNVDLTQNALVVGSLKVGSSNPTELTKAILDKLLLIQAAADADGTFDTRYNTKTSLAGNGGADLIGTANGDTVQERFDAIEAVLGDGNAADITYDNTTSGLTATNVQTAIDEVEGRLEATETVANAAIPASEKAQPNGVATLDGGGKIPASQLPNTVMELQGTYDADLNVPTLADGSGNPGDVYEVTAAGTQDLGSGPITFNVGDWVVYAADGKWYKSINSNEVTSVNGKTGTVILNTDDVAEGSTNLYHTDQRAADAAGAALADTATVDLSYTAGQITADVKDNSIGAEKLTTGVADQTTIEGGNGQALSVVQAPLVARPRMAGESMVAETTFAVRHAIAGETAGRMYKADKDASTDNKFFAMGLAKSVAGASAGDMVPVTMAGTHILGSADTLFSTSDIGKPVYVNSAGSLTTTPPTAVNSAVYRVGIVEDVDKIDVGNMQLHGIN